MLGWQQETDNPRRWNASIGGGMLSLTVVQKANGLYYASVVGYSTDHCREGFLTLEQAQEQAVTMGQQITTAGQQTKEGRQWK